MSMLNDSNPSIDALLVGFGNLSPEEQAVFLENLPLKRDNTDDEEKQARRKRLEEQYGNQSPEERKAAAKRFYDVWKGALVGYPDMTMKEIRAERLEAKYGKQSTDNESSR